MAADPRSAPPRPPRLALTAAYPDVRSEIVRPDLVQVTTRYFWQRWAPRLGPRATALILALRRRCYFNPQTGERRDWCWPSQAELALELGCERKAVMRALALLEREGFIRRERRFTANPSSGFGVSRRSDMIAVLMVEPLAPEDEARARAAVPEQLSFGVAVAECGEPGDNSATDCPSGCSALRQTPESGSPNRLSRLIPDKSHNGTHTAVPQWDRNTVDSEEALEPPSTLPAGNGRTVTARSGRTARARVAVPAPRIAALVLELEERLADRRSRGFFVRLGQRLPHDAIREAASEAIAARLAGNVRGSASAYFTGIVKRLALELGVNLEGS